MRNLAAAVGVLAAVLPAVAINPLDDDAGSGGDAGDLPSLALSVELPAEISGTLTPPVDMFDNYAFEGKAGTLLNVGFTVWGESLEAFLLNPDGVEENVAIGGTPEVDWPITLSGTWTLTVRSLDSPGPHAYGMVLTPRPAASWARFQSEGAWQVVEVRMLTLGILNTGQFLRHGTEVLGAKADFFGQLGLSRSSWSEGCDARQTVFFGFVVETGAPGRRVALAPAGVETSLSPVVLPVANGIFGGHSEESDGCFLFLQYSTLPSSFGFAVASDVAFEIASAHAPDGVWTWRSADKQLAVPGATLALAQERSNDVTFGTMGLFSAGLLGGSVMLSDGTSIPVEPEGFLFLEKLPAGPLLMRENPDVRLGTGDVFYAHMVTPPSLGLAFP